MESRTVIILLAVISVIVISGVLFTVFSRGESVFGNWVCRVSVYFSDQGNKVSSLFPDTILCKTKYQEVNEKNKERIMEEIARKMQMCWWMWGEGEWDPVGTNLVRFQQWKCFKCYVLDLPNEVEGGITKKEFETYLVDQKPKNSEITFWNYFNKYGEEDRVHLKFDNIKQNDLLSVVFFEEVGNTFLSLLDKVEDIVIGEFGDSVMVVKDNPNDPLKCAEIA